MTPQEFATKIKIKYPGAYDHVPDLELTQRVVAKYPVYASQVKMPEPQSFGEDFVSDTRQVGTDIATSFRNRTENVQAGKAAMQEGKQSGVETLYQTAGQAAGLLSDIFGDLVKGGVKAVLPQNVEDAVKSGIQKVAGGVGESDMVKGIIGKYNSLDERTKRNVDAALGIGSLGVDVATGGGSAIAGRQVVKQGIKTAEKLAVRRAATAVDKATDLVKVSIKNPEKALNEAVEIVRPALTPTEKELAMKEGRVVTKGIMGKTVVKPDVNEQRVAESISSLVEEGRVSRRALPEKNIEEISREVSRINSDVKNFIADRKVPFNEKQLRSKLAATKNDNKLIFASDPTTEKVFNAVTDEFVSHVKKLDTKGLFDARQSFDKLPAIKKLLENEKLGENVKRQIVLDVRRAANDYVSDLLPANSPYKALLKRETYMLEAIGNIAGANKGRIGTDSLIRLYRANPWLKIALPSAITGLIGGTALTN